MMPDVIVVGAGIAGMTAAIYLRRAEKEVVVFEAQNYGGQIINTLDIENYPAEEHISGFDLASKIYNQAKNLGVKFIFEEVTDITKEDSFKKIITKNNAYKCKAVILATGSRSRKLGLDNESELIGKGVSYCATCDGAFFKNKKVAVVGGGNTALEYALYLSDIAEIVYLVHRSGIFRGSAATVNLLKN
ncbi:MAG: FAD-dependent oxidoreductase, partial [Clostridia bacterium]|nr:FAD-dependent oxidoreductase [Clostridia bacterium]